MLHSTYHFEAARKIISTKARRLRRRPGFKIFDLEDLEQTLWCHLIQMCPKYDSAIGEWEVFVRFVLDNFIVSLIRFARAKKRDFARPVWSLSEIVFDSTNRRVHRSETVPSSTVELKEARDASMDLESAVQSLSTDQRDLIDAIRGDCIGDLARRRKWGSRRLSGKRQELAEACRDIGLDIYFT